MRRQYIHCNSLFPQHQIHHPAAADVRPRSAAMVQDVLVARARFRKVVGQFRHPLEGTLIVDGLGEGFHFGGEASLVESMSTEGVPEYVPKYSRLSLPFVCMGLAGYECCRLRVYASSPCRLKRIIVMLDNQANRSCNVVSYGPFLLAFRFPANN